MPMPPPKPTHEGHRDRQVFHEMGQIVRALERQRPPAPRRPGPAPGRGVLGAGRFDKALAFAVTDGLVHRSADGTVATSSTVQV